MKENPPKSDWRRAYVLLKSFYRCNENVLFFATGFIFDAVTLDRIDGRLDLGLQAFYLLLISVLLVLQHRAGLGRFNPSGRLAWFWKFNLDVLHFLFGGLLSAYFIFYTRSGINVRTLLFFMTAGGLFFYNELPQARRWGLPLRLAMYSFCLASFLVYFVPVLAGRIGDSVFLVSMSATLGIAGGLAAWMIFEESDRRSAAARLLFPVLLVITAIGFFYFKRWIPPVPLSMKYAGIFHDVRREGDGYRLTYDAGPRYAIFRSQDTPYFKAPGDRIFVFVRIFAPTGFTHRVNVRWMRREPQSGRWQTQDKIPLPIVGGRQAGFRGYVYKSKFETGNWRVRIETDDGRILGETDVSVEPRRSEKPRVWKTTLM